MKHRSSNKEAGSQNGSPTNKTILDQVQALTQTVNLDAARLIALEKFVRVFVTRMLGESAATSNYIRAIDGYFKTIITSDPLAYPPDFRPPFPNENTTEDDGHANNN